MEVGRLGLFAPLALLCFLTGTPSRTVPAASRAAFRQIPLTATEFTFTIQGSKQGFFHGDRDATDIRGLSYELQVTTPIDPATGQASGRRQYKPFVITKEWGASSPQILTALATNETLPAVQLQFFRTSREGVQVVDHVITLTNATIVEVHHHPVAGLKDSSSDKHEVEEISFTFRKIEVDDRINKTTFVDDWSSST